MLLFLAKRATVNDSPIAREAFNALVELPLKLTVQLEEAATFAKNTACVLAVSYTHLTLPTILRV